MFVFWEVVRKNGYTFGGRPKSKLKFSSIHIADPKAMSVTLCKEAIPSNGIVTRTENIEEVPEDRSKCTWCKTALKARQAAQS